ncbi:MAG TPA: hypothetical protein VJV79_29925 [Polyangiaceae bacterium]|nr:hypothetical protein [Polyangiaceae bacterium]
MTAINDRNERPIYRTDQDMHEDADSRFLVGAVLHDLACDAETLLLLAQALEVQASGISSNARPRQLRESAAIVKSAALQLGQAAANLVGSAERLRIVAEFHEIADDRGSGLPS